MISSRFQQDLERGEATEGRVKDVLRGDDFFISDKNGMHRFDFQAVHNGHTFRVEVKDEDRWVDSGNLAIELTQGDGAPSGIWSSEATICIHTLGERVAMYRRSPMLAFVQQSIKNKTYRMELFGKSTNNNCGVKLPIVDVEGFPWFAVVPFNQLGHSALWSE